MYRTKILAERITQWYPNLQVTCVPADPAMDGEAEKSYITQIGDEDGVNGLITIGLDINDIGFHATYEPNGQFGEMQYRFGEALYIFRFCDKILSASGQMAA